MAHIDEFLNPKSMLTPGAAGSLTMLIANTLWFTFSLPQRYSALAVSFLFALIVLAAHNLSLLQRLAFYVLNALIIFAVAIGTNAAGLAATRTGPNPPARAASFVFSSEAARVSSTKPDSVDFRRPLTAFVDSGIATALTNVIVSGDRGNWQQYEFHNELFQAYQSPAGAPVYSLDVKGKSVQIEPLSGGMTVTVAAATQPRDRAFFADWAPRALRRPGSPVQR